MDRAQPSLPMKAGRAGTMTHDYERNGTIELFAAMKIATGEVLTDLQPQAIHLEGHRRRHHRPKSNAAAHPPPDQNVEGPLGAEYSMPVEL